MNDGEYLSEYSSLNILFFLPGYGSLWVFFILGGISGLTGAFIEGGVIEADVVLEVGVGGESEAANRAGGETLIGQSIIPYGPGPPS